MKSEQYINSVNLNAGTEFPYLVLDVHEQESVPRNPGFQVLHWHEDLQFVYVFEGSAELQTLEESVRLKAGEGVFLNKNVVHQIRQGEGCHYNSFLFPERFLKFYPGSPAADLVEKITTNQVLPYLFLRPDGAWQTAVLQQLHELAELEWHKTVFYPYEVLTRLVALWLILQKNVSLPPQKQENAVNTRMRCFLLYVETHYSEEITLEQLAQSAHVSKSECLRCFRVSLQTTPYQYLMEHRLSCAARLLKETNRSIGGHCKTSRISSNQPFRKMLQRENRMFTKGISKNKTGCTLLIANRQL